MSSVATESAQTILSQFDPRRENLIAILQDIQAEFRYLPQSALREVSAQLDIPLYEVFHVATFYNCFSLEPVGRHLVQVCMGTACHVRGAPRVLDRLLRDLKLTGPGTTHDQQFTVRTVRCVGCCGLAPVIRADDDTFAHMTQSRVAGILKKYRAQAKEPVS